MGQRWARILPARVPPKPRKNLEDLWENFDRLDPCLIEHCDQTSSCQPPIPQIERYQEGETWQKPDPQETKMEIPFAFLFLLHSHQEGGRAPPHNLETGWKMAEFFFLSFFGTRECIWQILMSKKLHGKEGCFMSTISFPLIRPCQGGRRSVLTLFKSGGLWPNWAWTKEKCGKSKCALVFIFHFAFSDTVHPIPLSLHFDTAYLSHWCCLRAWCCQVGQRANTQFFMIFSTVFHLGNVQYCFYSFIFLFNF